MQIWSPEESAKCKEQILGNKHLASHQIPHWYNKMTEGADKRYWHKDKKAPQHAWRVPPQGRGPETRDKISEYIRKVAPRDKVLS